MARPEDDLLGRSRFANAVAGLIIDSPVGSSLRIGIYGDWG